jgi:hypothetical protein
MRVSASLVEAAAAEGAAEHEGVFLEAGLVLLVVELWCGSRILVGRLASVMLGLCRGGDGCDHPDVARLGAF